MNIERGTEWTLQPGAERDLLGGALRRVLSARMAALPATLARLLDELSHRTREKAVPRELIDTGTDKRFVRRDGKGQFKESDDVGRSLAQDQKRDSATKSKRGEGDKGDR